MQLLKAGRLWIVELRECPSKASLAKATDFVEVMSMVETTLRKNEAILGTAPFLIGQHVEVEQIDWGPRCKWVRGKILDYRIVLPLHPLLAYLVQKDDGEAWHASKGVRVATVA